MVEQLFATISKEGRNVRERKEQTAFAGNAALIPAYVMRETRNSFYERGRQSVEVETEGS